MVSSVQKHDLPLLRPLLLLTRGGSNPRNLHSESVCDARGRPAEAIRVDNSRCEMATAGSRSSGVGVIGVEQACVETGDALSEGAGVRFKTELGAGIFLA